MNPMMLLPSSDDLSAVACVQDLEVLYVIGFVGYESKFDSVVAFDLLDHFGITNRKPFVVNWMQVYLQLHDGGGLAMFAMQSSDCAEDATLHLDADGPRRFYAAASSAVRTTDVDAADGTFRMPLSSHLHDAQGGNGQDVVLGLVLSHLGLDPLKERVEGSLRLKVEEIDYDQAAQVS